MDSYDTHIKFDWLGVKPMFMMGGWKEQSFVSSVVVKAKGRTSLRLKKNAAMIKTRGPSRTRVACLKAAERKRRVYGGSRWRLHCPQCNASGADINLKGVRGYYCKRCPLYFKKQGFQKKRKQVTKGTKS